MVENEQGLWKYQIKVTLCFSKKYQEQSVLLAVSVVHVDKQKESSGPLQGFYPKAQLGRALYLVLPEPGQGAFKHRVQFSEIQLEVTFATIFSDLAFFFGSLEQCLAHLPMNNAYFL